MLVFSMMMKQQRVEIKISKKLSLLICVMAVIIPIGFTQNSTDSQKKRLQILVPVRFFNYNFIEINKDPVTKQYTYSGFAIDVFNAVNNNLPEPYIPEFTRFENLNGALNGSFDEMFQKVFNKEYDGIVGDTAIVDDRAELVEYTLPYLDSGISMLAPNKQKRTKTTRIPLINVTRGFVAATLAFSFLVALVFWLLGQRNQKKHVSQPQLPNLPTGYDKEIMRAIQQTRLLMVLLFMLLLVFTACYTASQTSSFVARSNQDTSFKNLNQLRLAKQKIGYQKGSFIRNILIRNGFYETELVEFDSVKQMFDLLSNNHIAAVVGLTVHLKLLQARDCDSLGFVPGFNLKAAGFGFAFQRDRNLAEEFSKGILTLIYNGTLKTIQDTTIGDLSKCEEDEKSSERASIQFIDYDTLWILVSGAISVLLLMVIIFFVHAGISCLRMRK